MQLKKKDAENDVGVYTPANTLFAQHYFFLSFFFFLWRCEGPSLRPNTCGIITAQPETRSAKRPTHYLGKNNIQAGAQEKSPAFMWKATGGDEVALACLLLCDPRGW